MKVKVFMVDIDYKYGGEAIKVRAKNKREAKKKAWERLKKRGCQRKNYQLYADEYIEYKYNF